MQKKTELIINGDGSIYHLGLLPGDIAEKILIVGDPGRVDMLAGLLKDVRVKKENREFHTVTGTFDTGEITIISSGIGTDNIDILVNELDALVNIDLNTGTINEEPVSLTFIRLGTSGALREDIPAGSVVVADTAIGFDGLLHFYEGYDWILDTPLSDTLVEYLEWPDTLAYPYAVKANKDLIEQFNDSSFLHGITISTPGFYAPQGRKLRLLSFDDELNEKLSGFVFRGRAVCNYEMESSALYALSALLGHRALSICLVPGNRITGEFMHDYNPLMKELALKILKKL
ncbi:MAG: nucleoside phosphorylase [Bacteroidales bacterium]|nr:nucleoside phosphorylase [Bacteroidales bacterium]